MKIVNKRNDVGQWFRCNFGGQGSRLCRLPKGYLLMNRHAFQRMTVWTLGKPIFYKAHLTKVPHLDELETGTLSKLDQVWQTTFLAIE